MTKIKLRHQMLFLFFVLFFAGPTVVLIVSLFAPGWTWPDIVPAEYSTKALQSILLHSNSIALHLGVSVLYSLATTFCALLLSILPAYHIARVHFAGKNLLQGILLTPALIPAMTFSMGIHHVFIKFSLADTFLGVVLILTIFSYPYMFRALISGFEAYSEEYELCAKNLGASLWMRLRYVTFPLLLPSMVAGGSVVFLVAFSDYYLVFLIGGGVVPSFTGYLFPFITGADRAMASALTLIFLIVPVILFVLVEYSVRRFYQRTELY
ncbi:ABC transporter permease [Halodesulfovibrio marinisediminis]|uniref:Putative spermidine/putrescine transport system permease protein n=1 Tax=Halodesulfovibrio marinisediminis DSM 17456 TaxID=1121457 RepID=A0A1N6J5T5_9BACT|nr:ABC transporter permease subunit [Halodesulfovibrio marinisediminis]SIO39529.1 putative spermidine/putrescine transport system permease protein [Halodesulfovibrio marinisediminis DSM 17456]